jgi:phytoene synthase
VEFPAKSPAPGTSAAPTPPAGGVCRALTKASRSSFTYAFLALPAAQREALYAIYAFCRVTDDLVDEAAPAADGGPPGSRVRLAEWRVELEACIRGEASHPVTLRLADVIRTYGIPAQHFRDLLDGVEMDLVRARYATFAELETYCYRVAGVVGLMCIEVFGYTRAETRTYAERLGTALQLTNILRDVASDGARGRIYLPLEDLARFGCREADLLEGRAGPGTRPLLAFQAARARDFYAAAQRALPPVDRRRMLPAEIMAAIYRRLLGRIERAGPEVLSRTVRLSDAERLLVALGVWARSRLTGR